MDISITLSSLVSVFPPSSHPLHQTGLEVRLASYYSNVVTPLVTLTHKYLTARVITEEEHSMLVTRLNLTRHHLVISVREILSQVCLATSLSGMRDENKSQ